MEQVTLIESTDLSLGSKRLVNSQHNPELRTVKSAGTFGLRVDDERAISTTLAAILKISGFRAEPFDHPENAIAAAADLAPDLLITDV